MEDHVKKDFELSPAQRKHHTIIRNKKVEVGEDDVIFKINCKFCNHPIRSEAEKKWDETQSYTKVRKLFEAYRVEHPEAPEMKGDNIYLHINRHYVQQSKKIKIREYCEFLSETINDQLTQEQRLQSIATSLLWEYFDIAASVDVKDSLKKADTMVKLSKQYTEIVRCQAELRGDITPMVVMAQKIMNTFVRTINIEQDPVIKKRFTDLLDVLHEQMQGIDIDNQQKA